MKPSPLKLLKKRKSRKQVKPPDDDDEEEDGENEDDEPVAERWIPIPNSMYIHNCIIC